MLEANVCVLSRDLDDMRLRAPLINGILRVVIFHLEHVLDTGTFMKA